MVTSKFSGSGIEMATTSSTGCRTLTFSFLYGLRDVMSIAVCVAQNLTKYPWLNSWKIILIISTPLLLSSSDLDFLGNKSFVIRLDKFLGSHTINTIIVCKGVVTVRVLDVKHQNTLPLFQGVLEIPVEVIYCHMHAWADRWKQTSNTHLWNLGK